ncbi:MAG: phosphomevalonate kinase [Cystobacterineae bacterium]|nr:phosphomevalonate kinase [Cystobacterineae bacterium]
MDALDAPYNPGAMKFLSAPGKLFVAGEYAVVWGGTARVLAVGPRALAAFQPREDCRIRLELEAGGLEGEVTPAGVSWRGPVGQPFLFAARAIDKVLSSHGKASLGFGLAMAPTPLLQGHKLGLGSSARAAVLATNASLLALGSAQEPLPLALGAHADAQGGRGSGADVAACQLGGLVRYLRSSPPRAYSLHPKPFALAYVFMGRSASTVSMLKAIEARHNAKARQAFVLSCEIFGEQLERAWIHGEFEALAEAVEALQSLLDKLLGEIPPEQQQIIGLAKAYGCSAKQSGAGGGDGCIVFAPDEGRREELLEAFRSRGYWGMPLEVEAGVAAETGSTPGVELLRGWLSYSG